MFYFLFKTFKRCDILGNWCGNPGILFQTSVAEISCCSQLLNTVKALKDRWLSLSKIMMTKSASRKCCSTERRVIVWNTLHLICSSLKTIIPLLQQTKSNQLHPFKHLELQTRRAICNFILPCLKFTRAEGQKTYQMNKRNEVPHHERTQG